LLRYHETEAHHAADVLPAQTPQLVAATFSNAALKFPLIKNSALKIPRAKTAYMHLIPALLGWSIWALLSRPPTRAVMLTQDLGVTATIAGVIFIVMLGCVSSTVKYADKLAERLGEPLGTLVLTLSSTCIEVSLMLHIMFGGEENHAMLRDTVFAALMITLNGVIGLALFSGGLLHREQSFNLRGALSFLQLIAPLSMLMLIMPNYTESSPGPTLAPTQSVFLGALCAVVYGLFLMLQTGRHRAYFSLASSTEVSIKQKRPHSRISITKTTLGLIVSIMPVMLLSEWLAHIIDFGIEELHAPAALGGVIIASLALFPEAVSAIRSALANRMQRSINICLGSALSTIGLTVPTVIIVSGWFDHPLILGLSGANTTLLQASLMIAMLTFISGAANLLQGVVHLMLFLGYLIFILFP
jgi:Ca2+:H+ antiporter